MESLLLFELIILLQAIRKISTSDEIHSKFHVLYMIDFSFIDRFEMATFRKLVPYCSDSSRMFRNLVPCHFTVYTCVHMRFLSHYGGKEFSKFPHIHQVSSVPKHSPGVISSQAFTRCHQFPSIHQVSSVPIHSPGVISSHTFTRCHQFPYIHQVSSVPIHSPGVISSHAFTRCPQIPRIHQIHKFKCIRQMSSVPMHSPYVFSTNTFTRCTLDRFK